MNMNTPRDPWDRLTAAARQVQDDRDMSAPYGFATRMAALAYASERKVASLFDAFALRAFGVAALLAIAGVAINYETLTGAATSTTGLNLVADATIPNDELILPTATDAVAVILDIAD